MVAQAIVEAVVGGAKVVIGGSIVVIGSDPVIGGATVVIGGPIVVIGADSPSHNSTSAEIRFLLAVNSGVSESRCEYKSEQCD